jgi:hypothetical protein
MLAQANLENSADYQEMADYMTQMMGNSQTYGNTSYPMMSWMHGGVAQSGYGQIYGLFHLVSWVLVMALIVAATRYLWNKGGLKK